MSDIWVQLNSLVNKYTGVINWYKRPNDNRPLKEEAKETDNSKYTTTCRLLQQWQLIKQYDGLTIQVCYLDGIWSACPWGATNTVLRKKSSQCTKHCTGFILVVCYWLALLVRAVMSSGSFANHCPQWSMSAVFPGSKYQISTNKTNHQSTYFGSPTRSGLRAALGHQLA
jgi:hypothetical protein